jgi:hypothetical protein
MTTDGERPTTVAKRALTTLTRQRSGPALLGLAAICLGLLVWLVVALVADNSSGSTGTSRSPEVASGGATPTASPGGSGTAQPPAGSPQSTPSQAVASAIPPFADRSQPVATGGTVLLVAGGDDLDLESWGLVPSGDIAAAKTGLTASGGTGLGLLGPVPTPSFGTCRNRQAWRTSVRWQDLDEGSYLCVRTAGDRRGLVRIDRMPEPDESNIAVTMTGVVWTTRVGG